MNIKVKNNIKYIDLFSGMGGFRAAVERKKTWKCVMFCEIDPDVKKIYENNFSTLSEEYHVDILKLKISELPDFDLLFAGFPCQPFSKAGKRTGFDHDKGNLFNKILEIIKIKKPKIIFLENVCSLATHNKGGTYKIIKKKLEELGYKLPDTPEIISPVDIGIPLLRKRLYIVSLRGEDPLILKRKLKKKKDKSISEYISNKKIKSLNLNKIKLNVLKFWEKVIKKFYNKIPTPLWLNYNKKDIELKNFPDWKIKMFNKTLIFLEDKYVNKEINKLKKEYNFVNFITSHKKLEWNLGNGKWQESILQFRPSGLRFKKFNKIPTLVALNQRPYIPHMKRYISVKELLRLYGFPNSYITKDFSQPKLMKFLGNTVSVDVVKAILSIIEEELKWK